MKKSTQGDRKGAPLQDRTLAVALRAVLQACKNTKHTMH